IDKSRRSIGSTASTPVSSPSRALMPEAGVVMKPLEGIRILDLSRVVSGPFGTMILADLGAEVIKIEEPTTGDESRGFGPPFVGGESAYFLSVNRGKKSCAVDLKTPGGLEAVEQLVRKADVLVDR